MKKKILISVLGVLCTIANVFSQTNSTGKMLTVGDRLPDVNLSNIGNYAKSSVKLSEFNTPLVILDFWATWCGSCIKEFPHVEALAREFRGQVQFLLVNSRSVTKDDPARIKYMFSYTAQPKHVPLLVGDSTLCTYFALPSLPSYVWLKADGTVLAITGQDELTESKIKAFLKP